MVQGQGKGAMAAGKEGAAAAMTADVLASGKFGGWAGGDGPKAKGAGLGGAGSDPAASGGAGQGKGVGTGPGPAAPAETAPGPAQETTELTEGQTGGATAAGAQDRDPNPLDGETVHHEGGAGEEEVEDNEPLVHEAGGDDAEHEEEQRRPVPPEPRPRPSRTEGRRRWTRTRRRRRAA